MFIDKLEYVYSMWKDGKNIDVTFSDIFNMDNITNDYKFWFDLKGDMDEYFTNIFNIHDTKIKDKIIDLIDDAYIKYQDTTKIQKIIDEMKHKSIDYNSDNYDSDNYDYYNYNSDSDDTKISFYNYFHSDTSESNEESDEEYDEDELY